LSAYRNPLGLRFSRAVAEGLAGRPGREQHQRCRADAEQPGGGQWTSGPGSSTVTDTPSGAENEVPADDLVGAILDVAQQLAAGRATLKECINLCYPILERYQPRRSDLNEFDFRKCLNACLGLR